MANINRPDRPETGQSGSQGKYSLSCSDVGFAGCNWQTQGSSPVR